MIYAESITKYDCTIAELEERLLFWVAVAGKNANTQAHKLEDFLLTLHDLAGVDLPSFAAIRNRVACAGTVRDIAVAVGLGKYRTLVPCYEMLAAATTLDLRTCTREQLMHFPGIGPKTASCFILHSRAGAAIAGLDRHVMRFLRARGHTQLTNTPGNPKEYARLEAIFLQEADHHSMAPADFDLMLWKIGARREL